MIRKLLLAAAVALAAPTAALAQDGGAPKFSVAKSTIGELLDNAEAKAAFAKTFPEVASNDQIEQAREMTLEDVRGFAPEYFPEEKLKELDAELAKIK